MSLSYCPLSDNIIAFISKTLVEVSLIVPVSFPFISHRISSFSFFFFFFLFHMYLQMILSSHTYGRQTRLFCSLTKASDLRRRSAGSHQDAGPCPKTETMWNPWVTLCDVGLGLEHFVPSIPSSPPPPSSVSFFSPSPPSLSLSPSLSCCVISVWIFVFCVSPSLSFTKRH